MTFHLGEGQYDKAGETLVAAASMAFGSGLIAAIGLALLAQPIAVMFYNKPKLVPSLIFLRQSSHLARLPLSCSPHYRRSRPSVTRFSSVESIKQSRIARTAY
jgi:hypothetical protein